jgi:hypothetical protein
VEAPIIGIVTPFRAWNPVLRDRFLAQHKDSVIPNVLGDTGWL